MEILPVLDLLNGIVVRGIAGRRSEYLPLKSSLTQSVQPLDVARALRARFGWNGLYVADLDAIQFQRPNRDIYRALIADGFRVRIDAGIQTVEQSLQIRECGGEPIIGLESCSSPTVLADISAANQSDVTFSLDLLQGQPMLAPTATGWSTDPAEIVRQAVLQGVRRIIVLDLADVGTSSGGRTDELCRQLVAEHSGLQLICGGGVRGIEDLIRLRKLGAKSVLVASALHDGRLAPDQLQILQQM